MTQLFLDAQEALRPTINREEPYFCAFSDLLLLPNSIGKSVFVVAFRSQLLAVALGVPVDIRLNFLPMAPDPIDSRAIHSALFHGPPLAE